MNFDFDEDQKALQMEARRFLDDHARSCRVREVVEGVEPYQKTLWKELGEMGFLGAAIPEALGGSGLGYLELCLIAQELGRSLAAVPFSSTVYLAAEIIKAEGSLAQQARWLPAISKAETIACLAVEEASGQVKLADISTSFRAGRLEGLKRPVLDGGIADIAIVLAKDADADDGLSLFIVALDEATVSRTKIRSLDPTRALAALAFNGAAAERIGEPGAGHAILEAAYDRAAILLAFEQVGGAEKTLWMARDYALTRYAFGRPIGSFQALKHLLADMYASATLAQSNAFHGAWALSSAAAELPLAAAYARVSGTQAYQFCASNNIQVHGGMGFTWELDCHLYYRRSNMLALQCGSLSEWEGKLVHRLGRDFNNSDAGLEIA